ncbi:MAG: hypothetical protein ACP5DX_09025 [Paracoccaceae bacterium]
MQTTPRPAPCATAGIIGPYSDWPSKAAKRPMRRYAAGGATAAAAALFVHCVVPLL